MSRAQRMHRGAVGGRGRAWPTAPLPHALPAQGLEAGGKPVIVTGDLNCAHRKIDIHSPKTNLRYAVMTCMPLLPPTLPSRARCNGMCAAPTPICHRLPSVAANNMSALMAGVLLQSQSLCHRQRQVRRLHHRGAQQLPDMLYRRRLCR